MSFDRVLGALNPEQREAVTTTEGPLLVLAGAGSGKTRVVTTRVAYLITRGVPAAEILAVTFTNRAADEMKERIGRLVGARADGILVSTFHALGFEILRDSQPARRGRRRFTIVDQGDQIGLVREILRRTNAGRSFDAWALLERISRFKNAFLRAGNDLPVRDEYDEMAASIFGDYGDALSSLAAFDFDDLICEPVRLLEAGGAVTERWSRRFRYLHVDEYQDTSPSQLRLVAALARSKNLCVVGDDDQSIYGWRGADVRNILEFDRHFPNARVVKLERNYRSTANILEGANAVIAKNDARHPKTLRTHLGPGDPIEVVVAATPEEEAAFVVGEIRRLLESARKPRDLAILFRASNLTQPFEEQLRLATIPFHLAGGSPFYARKEVKDAIAYLRVVLDPKDELALRRIVNYPARGVGPATLDAASRLADERGCALLQALEALPPDSSGAKAAHTFLSRMLDFRKRVRTTPFPALAREVLEEMGLRADLAASASKGDVAEKRWGAVLDLLRAIEAYAKRTDKPDFLHYLHMLTLRSSADGEDDAPGDVVTLSTLHAAKGLEFPVVFIVGFEEQILPHARALSPRATDALPTSASAADLSEERRLCYVGITRARERLYLTRAATRAQRGAAAIRTPSRFLADIPERLLRIRSLEELEDQRREKNAQSLRAAMRDVFD
jgi:DNA helicase-2/ATP-dependent DNA helicase PcrA